jgi:P2-related tail formation protein
MTLLPTLAISFSIDPWSFVAGFVACVIFICIAITLVTLSGE